MLKGLINRLMNPNTYSSEAYINYIRRNGGVVGKECFFFAPKTINIDKSRMFLIELGDHVVLTADTIILTHDYSHTVARKKYGINIGDAKPVKIGNNVFVGMRSIILMGTEIGNNTIIGAGSVVSGKFPDDVVIAGNPARVICSIEDYYKKRLDNSVVCAKNVVNKSKKNRGCNPTIKEMGDAFAWLYLERSEKTMSEYPEFFDLAGDNSEEIKKCFMKSEAIWNSYDEFLNEC